MTDDLQFEAEMIKLGFQNMYLEKARNKQERTGLHASSLLVNEQEWCTRKHVLINLYPEQVIQPRVQSWDWKREIIFSNGWKLHERWQQLFEQYGTVKHSVTEQGLEPELDLTHYDEEREVYFSPDAILEIGLHTYVVEIKGIKQESYEKLTDDVEQACSVNDTVAKARIQANLYMHMTGLERAILLIENKNTQDFKVYVTTKDVDLYRPYRLRMYQVKAAMVNAKRPNGLRILPARVCQSIDDTLARSCPMRDVCFREE